MDSCDGQDPRQQWTYDASSGRFVNEGDGMCLYAQRPDAPKDLTTWDCDDAGDLRVSWEHDDSTRTIRSTVPHIKGIKCWRAETAAGAIPSAGIVCDETAAEQRFDLVRISTGGDGVCSKYSTTGWHAGYRIANLNPSGAANGHTWQVSLTNDIPFTLTQITPHLLSVVAVARVCKEVR